MKTIQAYRSPLFLVVAIALISPMISSNPGALDTSLLIATYSLISVSLGFCYGQAGMLSLAQPAFAAMGAYTTAIASARWGTPWWVGLLCAMAVAFAVAFIVGFLVIRLTPMAFVLGTLTLAELFIFVIAQTTSLTGGYNGLSGIPVPSLLDTQFKSYVVGWAMVALAVLALTRLQRSNEGRALRLIHHDLTLARSMGIPVRARLVVVFAFGAAVAGAGGWLYAHTRTVIAPDSLPISLSITVFIMLAVGGRASPLGGVVGACLLTFISDYLPNPEMQGLFYGAILVVVVLLMPRGILGTDWKFVWKSLRRRGVHRSTSGALVAGAAE